MGLVLLLSGVGLLALPGLTRRLGRRLDPVEWARLCVLALAGGAAVLEVATLLYAAPTVLRAFGVPMLAQMCERMLGPLVPGGRAAGWTAAAAALTMPALSAVGLRRARRWPRIVRAEPWLGTHRPFGAGELVILPTRHPLALSVDGAVPQVLVSEGLVDALAPAELDAVLRHEAAHLAHGHQRLLALATALDHGLAFLPVVRRSTAALRVALERWADEEAAEDTLEARATVRAALLGVSGAMVSPGLAAFSAADTLVERLDALVGPPPAPAVAQRALLYVPGVGLGATTLLALGAWASNARMVVEMAGRCFA